MGNKRTAEEIAATRERNERLNNARRMLRLETEEALDRIWKDIQDAYRLTDDEVAQLRHTAEERRAAYHKAVRDCWKIDTSCKLKVADGEQGLHFEVMKDE